MAADLPFPLYRQALNWVTELHGSELRKAWPAPLLAHLVAVSSLVWEDGGDEEHAVGALLHDALVYGGCSMQAIASRFGDRVARIARDASDTRQAFDPGPRPPWLERRQAHINAIATLDADVVLVMAADKAQECLDWSLQLDLHPETAQGCPGGVEPLAWYYDSLHTALSQRLDTSRSMLLLGRGVQALQRHVPEFAAGTPEQAQAWLRHYPQRHRPALFS
jgi:(p)ppGpp synthase/HD superfamily hydrolase